MTDLFFQREVTIGIVGTINWCYNTLIHNNNGLLNVLGKSNFATPPFDSVSVCISNYNYYSFFMHQTHYFRGYQ